MSFRDDHDAALARIDALEVEVARARAGEREARKQLAAERRRHEAQVRDRTQRPDVVPAQDSIFSVLMVCLVTAAFAALLGMALIYK